MSTVPGYATAVELTQAGSGGTAVEDCGATAGACDGRSAKCGTGLSDAERCRARTKAPAGDSRRRSFATWARRAAEVIAFGGFGRSAAVRCLTTEEVSEAAAALSGRAHDGPTPAMATSTRVTTVTTNLRAPTCMVDPPVATPGKVRLQDLRPVGPPRNLWPMGWLEGLGQLREGRCVTPGQTRNGGSTAAGNGVNPSISDQLAEARSAEPATCGAEPARASAATTIPTCPSCRASGPRMVSLVVQHLRVRHVGRISPNKFWLIGPFPNR